MKGAMSKAVHSNEAGNQELELILAISSQGGEKGLRCSCEMQL